MVPILLVILLASLANAKVGNFIVGGQDASPLGIGMFASLEYQGDYVCGGTIISKFYVITSAQCEYFTKYLKVRAGTNFRGRGGRLHDVLSFVVHENYYRQWTGVPVNDIAIVRVREAFAFDTKVRAIGQFEGWQTFGPNDKGYIVGFGETNSGGPAKWLQIAQVSIVPEAICKLGYLTSGGLAEGQFCAGNMDDSGADVCRGDTGGPIVVNNRLAGIISWSTGCAIKNVPSVYTEIAHYREWIDRHSR